MAYDFNSLTKQAAEASNRDGFYTDFEDVDPSVLHQISQLTEWMRTKGKGSDVREVIAQLFERTWIEGTKEGNANFEVAKARGAFRTLYDRLEALNAAATGGPNGVFNNVTELTSAYPTGKNGIYVTKDTGTWWYWSESRWQEGGKYQTTTDYKDYTGLSIEIDFIAGEYVDAITGTTIQKNGVVSTGFIDLAQFDKYIYTEIFTPERHHAAFFDEHQDFISGAVSSEVGQWNIHIPSGAKFAKIAFYATEMDKVRVKRTDKESMMDYLSEIIQEIKSEIGTFVDFDILPGEYVSATTGATIQQGGVNSTGFIDLTHFKDFIYTIINQPKNYHVSFFDDGKKFVSGVISNKVGEWAIPIPAGVKYAKLAFYDADKDVFYVRNLATDNIFEALFETQTQTHTNTLKGKKIGIIGDSISTYNGHIPTGYAPFYPAFDVTSVDSTWWKQLINNTGMQLCVNASWSGSTITGNQDDATGAVGCSDARVNALTASNGDTPDIIIVYIGINDFGKNNGAVCGNYHGKTAISQERNVTSISDAFGILLSKLQTKYPKAQIFVSRIMPERYAGSMAASHAAGFPNINPSDNVSLPAFNEQIEEIASAFNCPVIPMDKAGVTFFNVSQYTGDSLHPKSTYMTMMAKMVQKVLEEYVG